MAPRKMKQVAVESNMEKNMEVRSRFKRVKAEMSKIRDDQQRMQEEQMQIRHKFTEVEMQCDQLEEETKMIMKQTARTHIKLALMYKILKARENGDLAEAATLTNFLREILANERANASLNKESDEEDP